MNNPDVSIILVNYNTRDLTRDCLHSVYNITKDLNFDIWVVDNNSKDGSCEMIKSEFPQVKLIENDKNAGFGCGNNLAIEKSTAKYVFLLNTDTILINNAVKILFDFLESNEKAGACGGCLCDNSGAPMHSFGELPTLKKYILRSLGLGFLFGKTNMLRDRTQPVEQIIGADLMIRKSILDKTGSFNPAFFLYMEELELEHRIQKESDIYYVPDAKIIHLKGASSSNKRKRKQIIKKSEYIYYVLTNPQIDKNIIKILFTLTNLYSLFFMPKEIMHLYKYIWTEKELG